MSSPCRKRSCHLLAVVLAGVWCGASRADDEAVYFSELPLVASVSRLPQRIADAPTAVTVIDRDMIKASGVRSLNDVFRLVPGFQTYPHNTEPPRVSYHGLNDEDYSPRVQVLIDGRSMYSPLFGNGVNWATIPVVLDDIERIEVVRGTNSVSYGSNAFLGVINIITVDPALTRGLSVSAAHGSQNVRDHGVRLGGRVGEIGDFRLTYRQQNDDGLGNRGDWVDYYQSRLFDFRADLLVSERNSVQIGFGQVEGVSGVGRIGGATFFGQAKNPLRDLRQSNTYVQLLWNHSLSSNSDVKLRYSYVFDKSSDAFGISAPWQTYRINQSGDEGVRHELELQHSLQLDKASRLVWGGSWREDAMRSDWVLPGQGAVHRDVARLFGNVEWRPSSWFTGNAGLSGENDSLAGFHPSSRFSANFHLTPENTIRVGYSYAHRTGSIVDYRGDWRLKVEHLGITFLDQYVYSADRAMKPEKIDTWEIGYLGDWRSWRASLDTRLFYEKIRDRLFVIDMGYGNDSIPSTTLPIQNVNIQGVEYQFKWQPFDTTRLALTQTFVRIDSDYLASALAYPNTTLSQSNQRRDIAELTDRSMPRRSTSLLLMQKLPFGFELSTGAYWQDKMKWSQNTWSEKYRRYDVRLAYPFRWAGLGGEVAYTIQSLNGAHNEYKWSGEPSDRIVDRRQWLTLRLDY